MSQIVRECLESNEREKKNNVHKRKYFHKKTSNEKYLNKIK